MTIVCIRPPPLAASSHLSGLLVQMAIRCCGVVSCIGDELHQRPILSVASSSINKRRDVARRGIVLALVSTTLSIARPSSADRLRIVTSCALSSRHGMAAFIISYIGSALTLTQHRQLLKTILRAFRGVNVKMGVFAEAFCSFGEKSISLS